AERWAAAQRPRGPAAARTDSSQPATGRRLRHATHKRGASMNREHCLLDRDAHVLTVTLNRPEAKNALSSGMLAGMYRAWRMLDDDPGLRVAILTGRGDVFCAGAGLKSMGAGDGRREHAAHVRGTGHPLAGAPPPQPAAEAH